MIKNLKMDRPRVEQRNVRDRSTSRFGNQIALLRQPAKPVINAPVKIEEPDLPAPAPPQILHKEIFNNNMATVEVTVRATPQHVPLQSKVLINDKNEPWRKVIDNKIEEVRGSFGKYDPLRTLHFLSKELQLKLQMLCPDDPNIQQIVNDMQNAMQRLPPDVISQFQENMIKESAGDMKFLNLVKKENMNQGALASAETTQQSQDKLEESIKRLEAEIKNKECAIAQVRKEKDEMEKKLATEKETVNSYRKQLEECVSEKQENAQKQIELLNKERDKLQSRVEELQKQVDAQAALASQDLKTLIDELRTKYMITQKENTDIRNELAQLTLNKDKLNMLLECKDKQLDELRTELRNIQSFICAQFNRIQSKTDLSASSSISSISKIWNAKCKSKEDLYLDSETVSRVLLKYKNVKAADSDLSNAFTETELNRGTQKMNKQDKKEHLIASNTTITTEYKIKEKYSSMRAVFSEIKRQAYKDSSITLSSCQPFNDLSSLASQQSPS